MTAPQDRAGVVRVMADAARDSDGLNTRQVARDQLAALEAAGLRVVPASVVEGLHNIAWPDQRRPVVPDGEVHHIAMLWATKALDAASPFAPPPQEETTDAG